VWGATLATAGILALVVGGLGWLGWRRLAKLGGPLGRVQRRWRDHLDWWQERVFEQPLTDDRETGDRETPRDAH
jgi:hypothetical protein